MAQAIKFKNFTSEDFNWSFDAIPFSFKAGQEIYLEDYKAKHFAKHLIDRELNKKGILTNNVTERKNLEKLCFPTDEVVTPLEALNIEETKKEKEVVKKGRKSKKVEEEEFSDLNKDE